MLNKQSENRGNQSKTNTVIGSFLVLTGFISLTAQSGLINQLVKNLDRQLAPVAAAQPVNSNYASISDPKLISTLNSNQFVVDQKSAFVISEAGVKQTAPNGYYKLSDDSIIKVQEGEVTRQATPDFTKQKQDATNLAWKLCDVDGGSGWMRCNNNFKEDVPADAEIVASQGQTSKVSVQDTLNRIAEA